MPDMRDAIARYLAYTQPSQGFGGQAGGQMPQGGFPGAPALLPGGPPGGALPPVGGDPQGMMFPRPGIPSNLQGYPQLPSGQFLPTPISDTGPFPGMPSPAEPQNPVNIFDPNTPMNPNPQPVVDNFTPPVNTPMQGPQIGGMDPNEWYRLYTGGR